MDDSKTQEKVPYVFFLIHMAAFGFSGFWMVYFANEEVELTFLYMHGGIAIIVYLLFYIEHFGVDEVKWLLINSALGLYGICFEVDWFLSQFGRSIYDVPFYRQVTPFFYYILYTFLLRQATLDLLGARDNPERKRTVEQCYIVISLIIYTGFAINRLFF